MQKSRPTLLLTTCCLVLMFALHLNKTTPDSETSVPTMPTGNITQNENIDAPQSHIASTPASSPKASSATDASSASSQPQTTQPPSPRSERLGQKTSEATITKDGRTFPLRTYEPLLTPNDPLYNQWWVAPNGMTSVWDIPAGSETTVAVIDTGFALGHQEFTNRWAVNSGEFGATGSENPSRLNCTDRSLPLDRSCNNIDDNYDGIIDNETGPTTREHTSTLNCTDQGLPLNKNCNLIDDDDNGYVDDYRGFDFVNFDRSVQPGETNLSGTGTMHGTMVAGVLGANGNNGVGMAGVNWHTKILPLQALNDDSYGDSYTVAEAVYYAADQGVDIISMSLGTGSDDPYLRLAVLYALDRGILVVAASGNNGCNCISYPANYPEVVAVGALGTDGNRASFSNYGSNLDITAPGQNMTTSYFTPSNQTSAYATANGTSFATPFMSGLFALGRMSQPNATWEEIIGTMYESSDRRSATAAAPHNSTLGWGVSRANTMMDRLRNANSSILRYQFGGGAIVGSNRTYQCQSGVLPATRYYELRKSGQINYTSSLRQLSLLLQSGWTSRQLAITCIGLPTDSVDTLRLIDLPSETLNIRLKQ